LKIPKGQSESVNGRTDNTAAKRTNNDLQNITQKTKDRVARTPLTGGELRCSGSVGNSCFASDIHRVTLVTNPVTSHEWGPGSVATSGTHPCSTYPVHK